MRAPFTNPIPLDQMFTYNAPSSHTYTIKWARLTAKDILENPSRSLQSIILIHGTPWSSVVWWDTACTLSFQGYTVYIFDHAGLGSSPPIQPLDDLQSESSTYDSAHAGQAAAFAALYHHWGFDSTDSHIAPPHVLAHDNGCLTALRAHILHNLRYASLGLINGVVLGPFTTKFFKDVAAHRDVFFSLPSSLHAGLVRGYISGAVAQKLEPEILDLLAGPWEDGGSQGRYGFWRQILQASKRDVSEVEGRYGSVGAREGDMPVRVFWGEQDQWIPVETAERIRNALGVSDQVVRIQGAGHLCMVDQPVLFAGAVGAWIQGVVAARQGEKERCD